MISSDDGVLDIMTEVNRERARLFAALCQGKIEEYTVRKEGNIIIFKSSEKVVRTIVKLNGDSDETTKPQSKYF